jgi:hypothetical protein
MGFLPLWVHHKIEKKIGHHDSYMFWHIFDNLQFLMPRFKGQSMQNNN